VPRLDRAGLLRQSLGRWVVVHEEKLSSVLSEFAHTLATDFPIQAILDHLVERIVGILPISSAGVTLISPGSAPHYIAASDESALRYERLQTEIGEGPCLAAYHSGEAVAIADLHDDTRFPKFGPAALEAGLVAVFTFPLRDSEGGLGALDLYRDTPGELDEQDMVAAQTLADVAAAYILNAKARDVARVTSDAFRHSALHDPLTGLPNRLLLQQRLEHAAQRAKRSKTYAAILFADLDRFKRINDTYGHPVGDELLVAVAHRLSALVRPGDTLARFSGDEFVFLCEELRRPADAELLAKRVEDAFSAPFMLGKIEVVLTASVGIAYGGHGEDVSGDLVSRADIAMYQAKRKGGASHQIIDLTEASKSIDRDNLEFDLRAAFGQDELELAYQPVMNSDDGITGVEALLRWTHPERGAIPAVTMIAIAEQSGLIVKIGSWVLERGCRDRCDWLRDHPGHPLDLAVNISARQLMSPDFLQTVRSILAGTGMDPTALIIEITENIFIEDGDHAMEVLSELQRLGIRFALDDFGTGYSSLSYLSQLPIDILKIDQSFVAHIHDITKSAAIVAAVTNLAHVLGLKVTAEGVETQMQHDALRLIGCESAQGYFYARPMTASAIDDVLAGLPDKDKVAIVA
jgi:diguanylate cyclase (GGDEF)-like protein